MTAVGASLSARLFYVVVSIASVVAFGGRDDSRRGILPSCCFGGGVGKSSSCSYSSLGSLGSLHYLTWSGIYGNRTSTVHSNLPHSSRQSGKSRSWLSKKTAFSHGPPFQLPYVREKKALQRTPLATRDLSKKYPTGAIAMLKTAVVSLTENAATAETIRARFFVKSVVSPKVIYIRIA